MIDPTGLNEQLKKVNRKPSGGYGRTFWTGLLGGLIGGLVIPILKGYRIDCFPLFMLAGIGVAAMYFYFVDMERRHKKQLPVLFLAGLAAVIITLFFYIVVSLYVSDAGVTARNVFDAYFRNSSESAIDSTLLFHLVACFFTALGLGGAWLYVTIATPKWEQKHGKSEPVRRSKSKRKR